jgi:DNA repair protein RecN (Recombination protein N)
MLKSLEIQNYALLDQVNVKFQNGLIVFTGETGAGKSIFIDALGAILGEKVDETIVRAGADKAVVEAIFSTDESIEIQNLLKELDLWDDAGDLILRREIFQSGRTRAFANDTPINQPILLQLGDLLVDLHGQHEHQSLLKVAEHAKLLDQYGGIVQYVQEVGVIYQEIYQIRKKLASLKNKESEFNEKKQLFEFQIEEINQISPQVGEEAELVKEEKLLQNSEKLFQLTTSAYKSLYEDESAVNDALAKVVSQLDEIKEIDDRLTHLATECESARILVEEIGKSLQNYISAFEFNPDRLEAIRNRLGQLSGLKKKFRGSIEEVLRYRDQIQAELQSISGLDSEIEALETAFEEQRELISQKSLTLSTKRLEVAQKLKHFINPIYRI